MPESIPNEFGMPQDEDWDFDDADLSGLEEWSDLPEPTDDLDLNELDSSDLGELDSESAALDAMADEPAPLPEDLDLEPTSLEPETDEPDAVKPEGNDLELSEPADSETGEEPEQPETIELDDADLGEFDEAAALDAMAEEPAPLPEDLDLEPTPLEPETDEPEAVKPEGDDLELSEPADSETGEEPAQPETIELDDADLGEFDEAAALDAMAEEPAPLPEDLDLEPTPLEPETDEPEAVKAEGDDLELSEPADNETGEEPAQPETIELDDADLGEFDEAAALDAMAEEPAPPPEDLDLEPTPLEPEADEPEAVKPEGDDLELSEPADNETGEEPAQPETIELDDADLGEFDEAAALYAMAEEPAPLPEDLDVSDIAGDSDGTTELDDSDLGEFDESTAMEALPNEALSLQEALNPVDDDIAAEIEAEEAIRLEDASVSNDELEESDSLNRVEIEPAPEDSIGLDDSELEELSVSDEELGEFDESAALDAMEEESATLDPLEAEPVSEDSIELDDSELGEYDEAAALQDALALSSSDDKSALLTDEDLAQFDESATMATLLSESEGDSVGRFEQPLDSKVVDSAGMDIDTMLEIGEDWNGFNLTPEQQASISEDVPEEEKEVWGTAEALQDPEVHEEDWENQPDISSEKEADQKFMSVDELMAQVEKEEAESGEKPDLDAEALELNVGLDEFPDVLGDVEPYDVDDNSEAAGKLDLAKIYVEMNDNDGAIKLLEEAIVYGDDDVRREAKSLIDKLNEQ
ncbi:hypothetical protein HC752_22835 [Vibrio sp. S9_S30]|uniref:FimV/HubP family polar landmark protein n=1 Tax=Vibrio sp. S9_S30 TaxID=2720226 RepID=UPI00168193B0|nr:FimV/HubP family polar landmark protein [Vibrio sp. S9_S30]MBD1559777.1 hypothetical protein [Vibrio sp. S9_S30]